MNLKELRLDLEHDAWAINGDRYYEGKKPLPQVATMGLVIFGRVYSRALEAIVCQTKGHDWEDTSFGGPDRGWESGHCNRCGWGFHHTMY